MKSRRDALKALIVSVAAAQSMNAQQHEHGSAPELVQVKKAPPPVGLTADEVVLTAILTNLIIPRSDTPGAADAGVPLILDAVAGQNPVFQKQWKAGLAWLNNGRDFRALTEKQQIAILQKASMEPSTVGGKFFKLAKDVTIDAYYSTRLGLTAELGWHGNTFLTEFKGCTHPEHQV